jgi:pyruvate,water dikinase
MCIAATALDRARLAGSMPREVICALRAGLVRLGIGDADPVAVRSSALEEDSAEHSFAGQFESVLFQRGEAQIVDAIERCWASASSPRVAAYRRATGHDGAPVRMAVIVQRMVDSESAGVAFSRDPMRPARRSTIVVESVWGQGEGLVSGAIDADRYDVDRETLRVHSTLAVRSDAIVGDPVGGTRRIALDDHRRRIGSLTEGQARRVAAMAIRLERDLGGPQDVEWAFAGGRLYCLQARPITTLPPDTVFDPAVAGPASTIWDNSNIVESYAGVTSPLTFSHVSRCYRQVYIQFCRLMGVPARVIEDHEPMFGNMLGLVRGRIYYNLVNWYRLVALFPGSARSARFMEAMMGVKQSLSPELAALFDGLVDRRYPVWRRLVVQVVAAGRLLRVRRYIDEFMTRVRAVQRPLETADLGALDLQAQMAVYRRLETDVLRHWTAPIVSDTRCMVAFGALRDLTTRWLADVDDGATLYNDLLSGGGELPSAEPARLLVRIAERVREDEPVRDRFLADSPDVLRAALADGLAPPVAAMIDEFLVQYGFRSPNELKLEEPDLHDDPRFVIATIQSHVRRNASLAANGADGDTTNRRAAETRVRDRLRGPKRWTFLAVLRWARSAVRDRERLRLERTRMFGVTRRLFRGIGANLARLGVIGDASDVFFLTIDELIAFADGRSLTTDFRALVALRRRENDEYRRTEPPPDRFVTRGAAAVAMRFPLLLREGDLLPASPIDAADGVLRGTPCSPGVVEGVVRVARRVEDAEGLNGEILVTERTDPGWVPLFPACAGLIIERGSLLSHSAVVARELGIPTIVGVNGRPVDRLVTGQRVRLDAGRGEVTVL